MQNAENVPPVYEMIWQCDGTSEGSPKGDSRFFSSTDGTDAEQQKVRRQHNTLALPYLYQTLVRSLHEVLRQ